MYYQERDYWCGPCSVQNAADWFGIETSQEKIAEAMGTTEEGSDESDIMKGLDYLGLEYRPVYFDRVTLAKNWLPMTSTPLLLCIDNWEHWVCVLHRGIDLYRFMDGQNKEDPRSFSVGPSFITSRWGVRFSSSLIKFYAIELLSKTVKQKQSSGE